jgi:peptidoglycan/LPS O-acetylase OafA/YrhL
VKHLGQVAGIDLLRFFAASLVMVYHLGFCSWANPSSPFRHLPGSFEIFAPWAPYLSFGWVGVEIFFVISGFVIANSAEGKSSISFIKSRILRLGPGAWVCSSITLLVALFAWGPSLSLAREYVGSMLFVPIGPWMSGVYWTLGVEIFFYALIFLVLAFNRFRSIEFVFLAIGGVSTAFWLAKGGLHLMPPNIARVVELLERHRLGELLLLQHGCFFAFGGLLWLIYADRLTVFRVAICAFVLSGCLVEIVVKSMATANHMHVAISPVAAVGVWSAAMAVLVVSLPLNKAINARIGPAGSALRTLGLATYPLYLLHDVAGAVAMSALVTHGVGPVAALAITICALVTLAILSERFLEQPLRGLTRQALTLVDAPLKTCVPSLYQGTTPVLQQQPSKSTASQR